MKMFEGRIRVLSRLLRLTGKVFNGISSTSPLGRGRAHDASSFVLSWRKKLDSCRRGINTSAGIGLFLVSSRRELMTIADAGGRLKLAVFTFYVHTIKEAPVCAHTPALARPPARPRVRLSAESFNFFSCVADDLRSDKNTAHYRAFAR